MARFGWTAVLTAKNAAEWVLLQTKITALQNGYSRPMTVEQKPAKREITIRIADFDEDLV